MADLEENNSDAKEIALAGEYVLGILDMTQQQAVKKSLNSNPVLKHWVYYWEAHLPQLYQGIATKQPPLRVWKRIKQQIQQEKSVSYPWQKTPWWQGLILWRSLAVASILGVVSLSIILRSEWLQPESPIVTLVEKTKTIASPNYVAVVRDDKNQAFWHISLYLAAKHLFVTALQPSNLPANQSYELWLLSKDKQTPPRSMGLMPTQGSQRLSLTLNKAVLQAEGLAVSLEPFGGSPLSIPSGPVIFQAKLEQII